MLKKLLDAIEYDQWVKVTLSGEFYHDCEYADREALIRQLQQLTKRLNPVCFLCSRTPHRYCYMCGYVADLIAKK